MSRAAEAVKVSKPTLYALREADPEFARKWEEAIEASIDELEEEARRRAYEGVDEPVFFKGKQCRSVKRYSDGLMQTLLKAHRPEKYRENVKVESDLTDQSAEAIAQSLVQALIRAAEVRRLSEQRYIVEEIDDSDATAIDPLSPT
jgi:hypothetical protein